MAQGSGKRGSRGTAASAVEQNGRDPKGTVSSMTDLEFLRGLIAAIDESGIDTVEIHRAGTRIRIAKTPVSAPLGGGSTHASAPSAAIDAAAAVPAPVVAGPPVVAAEPEAKSNLIDVKSPMVGTFYRAPAPDAPPYVERGSPVTKGQTLCILEAMKLMNELQCEVDGVIRDILVEDTEPVEYGQVLFRIEPTGSR